VECTRVHTDSATMLQVWEIGNIVDLNVLSLQKAGSTWVRIKTEKCRPSELTTPTTKH
jgi:hypothetical protein